MRHCQSALSSIESTLIFFTATILSSDRRLARCTTANLPLPMGLMSSYLPSIIVWGCGAGSAMAVVLGWAARPALPARIEWFVHCLCSTCRSRASCCAHCGWRQASGKPKCAAPDLRCLAAREARGLRVILVIVSMRPSDAMDFAKNPTPSFVRRLTRALDTCVAASIVRCAASIAHRIGIDCCCCVRVASIAHRRPAASQLVLQTACARGRRDT